MTLCHFNLANVALEHVILDELGQSISSLSPEEDLSSIGRELEFTLENISQMQIHASALRQQMLDENYEDLSELREMNFVALSHQFQAAGIITDHAAWHVATAKMQEGGFVAMLDFYDSRLMELVNLVAELQNAVGRWISGTSAGSRTSELEDNGDYNFKLEFARAYAALFQFSQIFLSSSLISTEAWYRHNNNGTLIDGQLVSAAAA